MKRLLFLKHQLETDAEQKIVYFNWDMLEKVFPHLYGLQNDTLIPIFDRIWKFFFGESFRWNREKLSKYGIKKFDYDDLPKTKVENPMIYESARMDFHTGSSVKIILEETDINPFWDHGFEPFKLKSGFRITGSKRSVQKFLNIFEDRLINELEMDYILESAWEILQGVAEVNEGVKMLIGQSHYHLVFGLHRNPDTGALLF